MKILWISEFNVPSGFARVSKALTKNLQKQFDITVLDWCEEKSGFSCGVKYVGKKSKDDYLGIGRFLEVYTEYDAIFILNDVWNIAKYLRALKDNNRNNKPLPKIVAYFPVDARLHNIEWYKDFDIVQHPVTYTEFAKSVVAVCSPTIALDLSIVPHGIDTDVFYKSQSDRSSIREHVYGSKQLAEAFIFMNANRNQPRKKLDITVRAFAEFLKQSKAENAFLHLHCGLADSAFIIPDLLKRFGINGRTIITGETKGMQNISSELLNLYYNAADVGLNSSMGEGFGLCSCEHAITGAAQIVPNHSACAELFKDKALLIDCPTDTVFAESVTIGRIPDYKHMASLMKQYYDDESLRKQHGEALMKHFSSDEFNWKLISSGFAELFNYKLV